MATRIPRVLGVAALVLALSTPAAARTHDTVSTATYHAVFQGSWTADAHPNTALPASPHFSPIIGAVHDADAVLWRAGQPASDGLEQVAETGDPVPLTVEIEEAMAMGDALSIIRQNPPAEGNTGTVTMQFEFMVTADYPLLSFVTMIAPSPDWFVGVSGLSLATDAGWTETLELALAPYDAGTEDGGQFSIDNAASTPHGVVTPRRLPFIDLPMATLTLTRVRQGDSRVLTYTDTATQVGHSVWYPEGAPPGEDATGQEGATIGGAGPFGDIQCYAAVQAATEIGPTDVPLEDEAGVCDPETMVIYRYGNYTYDTAECHLLDDDSPLSVSTFSQPGTAVACVPFSCFVHREAAGGTPYYDLQPGCTYGAFWRIHSWSAIWNNEVAIQATTRVIATEYDPETGAVTTRSRTTTTADAQAFLHDPDYVLPAAE